MVRNFLSPLAEQLRACLCDTLAETGRPVCVCMLYHGSTAPPMDHCDCRCPPTRDSTAHGSTGQAWVRLASIDIPGDRDARSEPANCGIRIWRGIYELGVYRCVSTGEGAHGQPPGPKTRAVEAQNAQLDAVAIIRTLSCCAALADRRWSITSPWRPIGPTGGCAGSSMQIGIEL